MPHKLCTRDRRIRRSVWQPFDGLVSLVCDCGHKWTERWGDGYSTCPKCDLNDYIGEEHDYD